MWPRYLGAQSLSQGRDTASWPEQSADAGAGEWFSGVGRQREITWFALPYRGSHSQPKRCWEWGDLVRCWDGGSEIPPDFLTWSQACEHPSPWGFLPESPGGVVCSHSWHRLSWKGLTPKDPVNFWRSTVKQSYCQRQRKAWEAQWPPITSPSCSFTHQVPTMGSLTLGWITVI